MSQTYFDDIPVGWTKRVGEWELEEAACITFARQWDPQPFHTDPVAAAQSIYGGLTASSLQLFAICTRLFFDFDAQVVVLAMLGKEAVRFPHPARVGEKLLYSTTCVEARASRSKSDRGVVRLRDTLSDSAGQVVLSQDVDLMVARRPPSPTG
ncbi:MAG: MaoC/PaaZ C-terminal domain-containing protein [Myxococcota bacterium]|nr:MaoC/PaaZ C-terminal domain-containing protein [Myxococcota bacterium]